jgi:hypothetical protein
MVFISLQVQQLISSFPSFTIIPITAAFVAAMERYGFPGLSAFDIVETGKAVREEIAKEDPAKAAAL